MNTEVKIGNMLLQNPVLTASGTFGYGEEFADFVDLNKLGGFLVKGITLNKREGNPYPRMAETPSGMLNAVGLQNGGVDYFISEIYPKLTHYKTNVIVNINGATIEEYIAVAEKINGLNAIDGVELNISCPNVKAGGMAFGTTVKGAKEVTKEVRKVCSKPLIVKLTPNVTDITEIAKAVEDEGADAVSLINTLLGMAIDVERRRPILSTVTGGLSGAAVKPIALRMVWQTSKVVKIPIVGIGGIMNANDALEFLIAGASAVQVGTANFIDPAVTGKIVDGINDYMIKHSINRISDLRFQ